MTDQVLSQQQIDVVSALSCGASMTAAAEQAGVHRNTIAYWRRNHFPFQYALADAQYDRAMLFREKAEELADAAMKTIQDILTDPKAPAGVRLKAALAIIETASEPPEPKKQLTLQVEKIRMVENPIPQSMETSAVHENAQTESVATAAPAGDAPVPQAAQSPINVHKDAQTPIRREGPKVGRNDACPCGSGKKHKRCCIDKPLAAAA